MASIKPDSAYTTGTANQKTVRSIGNSKSAHIGGDLGSGLHVDISGAVVDGRVVGSVEEHALFGDGDVGAALHVATHLHNLTARVGGLEAMLAVVLVMSESSILQSDRPDTIAQ